MWHELLHLTTSPWRQWLPATRCLEFFNSHRAPANQHQKSL